MKKSRKQRGKVEQLAGPQELLSVIAQAGQQLLLSEDISSAVGGVLASLGRATRVSRVYIFENHTDPVTGRLLMSQRYEWTDGTVSVEIDNPHLQNLPYDEGFSRWRDELSAGRALSGLVNTFPPEEHAILEAQNILSLLVVPIPLRQHFWGFIGFDDCATVRFWSQGEIDLLRLAASLLGGSIQRARAEEAVRQSTALLDLAIDGADLGVWKWDVSTDRLDFNERSALMLGYQPEELGNTFATWKDLVHPDDLPAATAAIQRHLADARIPYELELRMRSKRGDWRRILTRGRVKKWSADGKPLRFAGTHMDVTERRRMESALQQSEQNYRSVVDNIREVIFQLDPEWRCLMLNRAWELVTGFPLAESLMRNFLDFIHPEDRQLCAQGLKALFQQQKKEWQFEVRCLTRDSGFRWVVAQARLTFDEQETVNGVGGSLRDVTAQRQAQEQMEAALRRERELNRLRNEFVTMASHEFRTPLAGITHTVELLNDFGATVSPERRNRYHALILRGARRIDALIDEVLILGKAQAGRLTCRPRPLELGAFVERCVAELPLSASEVARVRIGVKLAKPTHLLDPVLLRHVLVNLVGNALKYSEPETQVNLSVGEEPEGAISIAVSDRGIGVPTEDLPALFNPFHRGSNVGKVKGSGVGLSIVKSCIEAHSGTIAVQSQLGQGSVFNVRLPASAPAQAMPTPPFV